MTEGGEVVEDYGHLGLTLRQHSVTFLRAQLAAQRFRSSAETNLVADRRPIRVAGLVLVRQMPGSAKGVLFVTSRTRPVSPTSSSGPACSSGSAASSCRAGMLGVDGEIQREGEVVHVVARRLHDLTGLLASVGQRDAAFPLPHGRGDEARTGGAGPDPRDRPPRVVRARDMFVPDLHIDTLKAKTLDFR